MKICPQCNFIYATDKYLTDKKQFCSDDSSPLEPIKEINSRYKLGRLLGNGGMGLVYQAIDSRFQRPCAVKLIRESQSLNQHQRERFEREAMIAGNLMHPNVVTIFDYGVTNNNIHFIVMEYLEGETLETILEREKVLLLARALDFLKQCATALNVAHKKNIIHRDIKPGNIMVINDDQQEQVKLLDFGLAKPVNNGQNLTTTGKILGTPLYVSPEQIKQQELDSRSDLYSLAIVAYQMLTGRLPYEGNTEQDVIYKRLWADPLPPTKANPDVLIPEKLERAIMKALARERDERMAGVKEFLEELQEGAKLANQIIAQITEQPLPKTSQIIDEPQLAIPIPPVVDGAAELYSGGKQYLEEGVSHQLLKIEPEINSPDGMTALSYNNRGVKYVNEGQYDDAIRNLNKAIELDPKFATAYYNRGNVYRDKCQYDDAIRDFNKAIELDPKYALAYNNRGHVYRCKSQYDDAIRDFNKAIELDPKYAVAYYNRGYAYRCKSQYDDAIREYSKAIELDPKDGLAYNNRGYVYICKSQYDDAIRDFSKAIELDSNYALAYSNRGYAYHLQDNKKQAIADYKKSLEIEEDADVRNLLSEVQGFSGSVSKGEQVSQSRSVPSA